MTDSLPEIDVAAGVLRDARGRVLITRRPAGGHLGGWWEFPGGKLDAGEAPAVGLGRELREELGIDVVRAEALMSYRHCYPERVVNLHVWLVHEYAGAPAGAEGQALRWVGIDELDAAGLLPADAPIVRALANR